jgi:hypothetical protein
MGGHRDFARKSGEKIQGRQWGSAIDPNAIQPVVEPVLCIRRPATQPARPRFLPEPEGTAMTRGRTKNPDEEAPHPAPIPKARQGQGHAPKPHDSEARQGCQHGKKPHAKMAVHSDSPPGIELDGQAHVIPLDQRTEGDRRKALGLNKQK